MSIAPPGNPGQPLRQEIYLRALRSLGTECIYGRYLSHEVTMRVADPNAAKPFVRVIKTEEKGSDVNIAAHMLLDAFSIHLGQSLPPASDRIYRIRWPCRASWLNLIHSILST